MARIRTVTYEDLPRILEIEKALFSDPWDDLAFEVEMFLISGSYYYVLEVEQIVVGYAGVVLEDDVRHIATIAVDKEYQYQGYGQMLLDKIMGKEKTKLEVSVDNQKAISFYEKNGFKIIDYLKDYYEPGDAYLMMKEENYENTCN